MGIKGPFSGILGSREILVWEDRKCSKMRDARSRLCLGRGVGRMRLDEVELGERERGGRRLKKDWIPGVLSLA